MNKETLFERLEASGRLPELSPAISSVLAMLSRPAELDIDVLAQRVSECGQLHDLVMANLNSGYYQLNRKVASIREAVSYLGMQTVRNLLIFFISRQLFPDSKDKARSFDMPRYWHHVIGTSVASGMLSEKTRRGDRFTLFSYGLIHDIGIALLDACLPGMMDEIFQKVKSGVHQLVAERVVLGGLTHSEVGAWLCRRWNLREDITAIVEYHHTPLLAKSQQEDVRLIHVADVFSTAYYQRLLGLASGHRYGGALLDSLGLSDGDAREIAGALPQAVENLHHDFIVSA